MQINPALDSDEMTDFERALASKTPKEQHDIIKAHNDLVRSYTEYESICRESRLSPHITGASSISYSPYPTVVFRSSPPPEKCVNANNVEQEIGFNPTGSLSDSDEGEIPPPKCETFSFSK